MNNLIYEYLFDKSWRKKENANVNESFSNMQNYLANRILANDFLKSIPRKYRLAHIKGLIHIHNLESGGYIPYCAGHSLMRLVMDGMKTLTVRSKPPKHFSSFCDIMMNYLFCSQQEFAGAQSFISFDSLGAPFIKVDNLDYKEVKQQIQKLIYNLNMTMRASNQTPFTNLTLDYGIPEYLEDVDAIVGGETVSFKYSDCLDELAMIDRAISEVMTEKDPDGKPFTFPVLTINLTDKIDWNSEEMKLVGLNCSDVGSYYFFNMIGSGIEESTVRSMCCRLRINYQDLGIPKGYWNMFENTGSLGVCTINMPRLGYDCRNKDESKLLETLEDRMDMALDILLFRKKRIKKYMKRMMPFNLLNGWRMKNYYVTIGVIGLNEMCQNYLNSDLMHNVGFVTRILNYMRDWSRRKQREIKQLINIEMIPGEGASYRLAYVDRKLCQNIKTQGTKHAPYYTTLLIPPSIEIDLFDRLKIEEQILPLFTGGTIFRVFIGEHSVTSSAIISLIKKISSTKIPYYDITCTYSICKKEGKTFRGIHYKCPNCSSKTEIYSRVVGYYRPLNRWNIGKVQEFYDRKYTNLNKYTETISV